MRFVPLALTALRLALGPIFILLYKIAVGVPWLVLIVLLAMATDWLDGFTARRWNAVSKAGKLLDPLADALFCMIVFSVLAWHGIAPAWLVVILIVREALVTFIIRPVALQHGLVIAAGPLGKAKTAMQFFAMLLALIASVGDMHSPLRALTLPVFLAVLGLSVTSAVEYGRKMLLAVSRANRVRTQALGERPPAQCRKE